jgi:hypothetical protein
MSSSDETDDPIVDFKQPPRYTNLDYREKLSLRANEVSEMRVLCPAISDLNFLVRRLTVGRLKLDSVQMVGMLLLRK